MDHGWPNLNSRQYIFIARPQRILGDSGSPTDVISLLCRCSDCKNLDPEINKAADTLERRSGDIAKVDCFGAGKGLCEMYRVKSWPQLKLFKKGNYIGEYTGAQTGGNLQFH